MHIYYAIIAAKNGNKYCFGATPTQLNIRNIIEYNKPEDKKQYFDAKVQRNAKSSLEQQWVGIEHTYMSM